MKSTRGPHCEDSLKAPLCLASPASHLCTRKTEKNILWPHPFHSGIFCGPLLVGLSMSDSSALDSLQRRAHAIICPLAAIVGTSPLSVKDGIMPPSNYIFLVPIPTASSMTYVHPNPLSLIDSFNPPAGHSVGSSHSFP